MNRLERVFPFIFLFAVGLALTQASVSQDRNRVTIKWPSPEFRDLQSAIDAAPDDATIQIKEGGYQIDGPLFVRGKRLVFKGAGSGREGPGRPFTHLRGRLPRPVVDDRGNLVLRAEAVEGLWNFLASDVVIRDMKLSGFDAAIVSKPDERGGSGPTKVMNVVITGTGRGILSLSSSDLNVKNSTISNTLWNGISFAPKLLNPPSVPKLTVNVVAIICPVGQIATPTGAGIYFAHALTAVDGVGVFGKCNGGIVGFESSSFILNSLLVGNKKGSIVLQGGFSEIENNNIASTETLGSGEFGDGIVLWGSSASQQGMTANLFDNFVVNSARAGVSAFGATVNLADNLIFCSAGFDLFADDLPPDFTVVLNDLGGNLCGCGMPQECQATGAALEPPPPIGGLE